MSSTLDQPPYPAAEPAQPAPEQRTNGLAIAGFVLAFLAPLVGLILSLIAFFQIRKRQQKGRGLALAGIIISALATVAAVVLSVVIFSTVGKNAATIADPGCESGKDAIMASASMPSDQAGAEAALQKTIDGLNAAAAKAEHDSVKDAMTALAGDYGQLLQAIKTGTQPPADLESKINSDANKIDDLCTIGGARK